jgi:threonine aldolase
VAARAGTLKEYGSEFDTVSVCFSKGVGAPIGSILVGSAATMKHARWVRKSIGGCMRQIGPFVNAARVALAENFPDRIVATHVKAKHIEVCGSLGIPTAEAETKNKSRRNYPN